MAGISGAEWGNIDARIDQRLANLKQDLAKDLKPKSIPEWLRDSIPIVLLGALGLYALNTTIPALIDSKAGKLRSDIAADIRPQFDGINKRIDDALGKALDRIVGSATTGSEGGKKNSRSSLEKGQTVIQMAVDLDQRIDTDRIKAFNSLVSRFLQDNPTDLTGWRTAGLAINYKSSFASTNETQPTKITIDQALHMGLCSNVSMSALIFDANFNCAFNLGAQKLDDVMLENAVVFYDGGPIAARNVTLKNCYFVTRILSVPTPRAKKVLQTILASSGSVYLGSS